jgi:outer membrane protein assembly factor BamB
MTSLDRAAVGLPDVLSVLNAHSGKLLWRFQRPHLGITTPVPATDLIYVGASDHSVYAFAASTGQVRWQAQIGGLPEVEAVVSDVVLVLTSYSTPTSQDNVVYALGAGNGKVLWHTDLLQGVVPAIAAGKVYVETYGQDARIISALDARSGEQLWQYQLPSSSDEWQFSDGQIYDLTSPTHDVLTSVLFVVSGSTGKLLWRFPTAGEAEIPSLRVADGQVYLIYGSNNGHYSATTLSAFDARSGVLRWHRPSPTAASLLIGAGSGSVYVGTPSELVAFRAHDGAQAWRSPLGAGRLGLLGRDVTTTSGALYAHVPGQGLVAFNATDGSAAWHFPLDEQALFEPIAIGQGTLYASVQESDPARYQVLALDTRDGKLIWSYDSQWPFANLVAA